MMNKLLVLLCIAAMAITSCGDDESCVLGTFDENIVGTWDTPSLGDSESGTVTFNADGTGVGSENGLFYAELNSEGTGNFNWSYDMTTDAVTIDWVFSNGGLEVDMDVVSFDCDETTLNFFLDFTIERQ